MLPSILLRTVSTACRTFVGRNSWRTLYSMTVIEKGARDKELHGG